MHMRTWIPIQEKLPDENREFYCETDPACMNDNPDEEHDVYKVVGGRLLYRFGKKPWQDAGPFEGYATAAQGKWSYVQPPECKAPKRVPFSKWLALAKPDLYKALQEEYNKQEN